MYLLNNPYEADAHGSKGSSNHGGWSSLIGIVTAICGNIFISFALNTQRYAHIRLSRDRETKLQEKRRAARRKASPSPNYGTQQNGVAEVEQRTRQNTKSEPDGNPLDDPPEGTETDALILRTASGSPGAHDNDDDDDDDDNDDKGKSYLRSPIWWLGIALMVVGETGNFLAYGFAPASVVSPLGVVALVSNCIIAPLLLGEHFRWRDAAGVVIAVAGCVVVVLSANSSDPKLSPGAIWRLVTTWEFETYLGITIFLMIILAVASNKFGHRSILIDLGLVGLLGGYTALSTKGIASLLTYSIWRIVTYPITYLLLAVLVFTAVMQIKYVNRALQRFNATMVIPTQFVLFTISVILGSAVLYRDFEREKAEDAGKFVAGCALTFLGVWFITSGRKQQNEEQDEGDEETGISLVDDGEINIRRDDTMQTSLSVRASASVPPMERHHTAETILRVPTINPADSNSLFDPMGPNVKPLIDQLDEMPPGTASAVHIPSTALLHGKSPTGTPRKKPPLHATTSEPAVPTTPRTSKSPRPKTPLARAPTNTVVTGEFQSHQHRQRQFDPNFLPQLSNRHSVVGLFPGPLTSPLSGSLAAIVADELRRGSPSSAMNSVSRRRKTATPSSTQRPSGLNARGSPLKRHSIASGTEIDFDTEEQIADPRASGSPPDKMGRGGSGRMRSLSATLSDLFSAPTGSGSPNGGQKRQQQRRNVGAQERRREQSLEAAFEDEDLQRREQQHDEDEEQEQG